MKVSYATKKVEKLLTDTVKRTKKYGPIVARWIQQRLDDFKAAPTLADLPPAARSHPREPKSEEKFSVDIRKHRHPSRLIIKATGEGYDPAMPETIKEVIIQEIETNTHS